ncbi:MAG: terpene cyclase/mutase family protein [Anaerolineae bacterium]|nr:terpene cyclase/mutase family protein [Anaerolineae bacterium]
MRKFALIALIFLLSLVPAAAAQGDPAMSAADWVESQQAEDGSFAGGDADITSAVAIALALLERPNEQAMTWLENYVIENQDTLALDTVSTILLAAIAHDLDPATFAEGVAIAKHMELLRAARGEDITGMCFGLIAMNAMGQTLPPVAVSGLTSLQNEDGGFGAEAGGASEPVYTATCLHVLVTAGETEAVEAAKTYLAETALPDGGWTTLAAETSDGFATAFTLLGLTAAGDTVSEDWGQAVGYLFSQQDQETGKVVALPDMAEQDSLNVASTAIFMMVFRGFSYNDIGGVAEEETSTAETAATADEGPALDPNWEPVRDGFGMEELNTADDFFVTVVDPFTDEELYGVEIINWVAEYQYTGYIIEQFLPAEVLLWMNEQDAATFENIGDETLELLPPDVLAQLPEEIQARVTE